MPFRVTLSAEYKGVALPNGVILNGGESAVLSDSEYYSITPEGLALFSSVEEIAVPGAGMQAEEVSASAPATWDAETRTIGVSLGTTAGTAASGDHTHTAAQISDATTVGRGVLTAADADAARGAIGAGTSDLTLGTTASTAAAGNHTHPINGVTGLQDALDSKLTASQAAAVGDATDETDVVTQFNALLAALRAAGIIVS